MTTNAERWAWRITLAALASAAIIVTLLAGPWNFLLGSVTGSAAASREAPCLPGEPVEIMDSPHIAWEAMATVTYNSNPPTSGPHFGFTAATGIYTGPVPEGLTVHAMEHGHVVIQYAPSTPAETVDRLRDLAKRYGKDVILAPYPKLGSGIALTAWGRIDRLDAYDEARVTAFVEQLRDRYVHGWASADDCDS